MKRILLTSIIAAFAMTAPAVAQDPVADGYGGSGNVAPEVAAQAGDDATTGAAAGTASDDGAATQAAASPITGDELPFTGLDIGVVALAGLLLLAIGLGVRRFGRAPA